MAKIIRQYTFERKMTEKLWAKSEEEAREQLSEWYGEEESEFEVTDVTEYKSA